MPSVKELAEMLRAGWAGQAAVEGGEPAPSTPEDDHGTLSFVQAAILSEFLLIFRWFLLHKSCQQLECRFQEIWWRGNTRNLHRARWKKTADDVNKGHF